MQQQRKLHVQEKDGRQQKQQLGQLLQDAVDEDEQLQQAVLRDEEALAVLREEALAVLRDVLHQSEDVLHQSEDVLLQSEDVLHQSEKAAALEEEDVDKLPNPSFFQFFILTNCKLSLIRQHQ